MAYLVPGYIHGSAHFQGRPIAELPTFTKAVPGNYNGPLTIVTRVGERDGSVKCALFPLAGHEIAVSPDTRSAFFNSLDDVTLLTFDPDSLELGVRAAPHRDGFTGGGHAFFIEGGGALVATERKAYAPYDGRLEAHFGRIVIRDPITLRVLESYDCHGIAPHQVRLLSDGKTIAVANYGSTDWPDGQYRNGLTYVVEPCLTLLELRTGKLLDKIISPDRRYDLRHFAVHGRDRIFAIQGRLAPFADTEAAMAQSDDIYEPDIWSASAKIGYLPAPLLRYDLSMNPADVRAVQTSDPLLMRYGQSIIYDPGHDEAIATYPSRHCIVVFTGSNGTVKRVIRTDKLGLHQPRGIAFHPDGEHYAVTGYWADIFLFHRGTHRLARDRCIYQLLFGHSHSTVV